MQNFKHIFSMLDPSTKYIKVRTKEGKIKWKGVADELLETDIIIFTKSGIPYQMANRPGRKKGTKKYSKKSPNDRLIDSLKPKVGKESARSSTEKYDNVIPMQLDRGVTERTEKIQEQYKQKKRYLNNSKLLKNLRDNPESLLILQHIMEGIAGEVESMTFDRDQAEQKGESTTSISNRIIQGYRAIGDAWLRRKDQLVESELDLTSPAFANLLGLIIETIKECMQIAEIPENEIKLVLTKTGQRMNTENWIIRARKRMRGEDNDSSG